LPNKQGGFLIGWSACAAAWLIAEITRAEMKAASPGPGRFDEWRIHMGIGLVGISFDVATRNGAEWK